MEPSHGALLVCTAQLLPKWVLKLNMHDNKGSWNFRRKRICSCSVIPNMAHYGYISNGFILSAMFLPVSYVETTHTLQPTDVILLKTYSTPSHCCLNSGHLNCIWNNDIALFLNCENSPSYLLICAALTCWATLLHYLAVGGSLRNGFQSQCVACD